MKKLSLLSILLAGLLVFSSCDKGELGPVANTSNPSAPALTSPSSGESFTLDENQSEEEVMTIAWEKPDFGFPAAPTYTIQMDSAGDDFTDPIEVARVTQQTSYTVTTGGLNQLLLSAGLAGGEAHELELRVMASIPDEDVAKAVSESVALSITPYAVEINYPKIYVPGSYQAASGYTGNWSPADAPALYSLESNDEYEGYVYMANSGNEFKFTPERNWDNDWGDTGADGTLEAGGDNIAAADAGYYKMNANINDLTYTITNTDWAVTGSATPNGWAGDSTPDHDMTYDPQAKVWTVTLDLSAEELKFRANDAWDLDYGDTGADGELDQGGDNIVVDEAGNYTITLNLSEAPYTYSLEKN